MLWPSAMLLITDLHVYKDEGEKAPERLGQGMPAGKETPVRGYKVEGTLPELPTTPGCN